VCDADKTNIHGARGVAIREFPLKSGHGFADYLLYVDGKAAGVIEAKKEGVTLTGVETQAAKYIQGLPEVASTLGTAYEHAPPGQDRQGKGHRMVLQGREDRRCQNYG
jgi:hypothetical protein